MKKKVKLSNLEPCNPSTGCCTPNTNMPRREFVKLSALGAALFAIPMLASEILSLVFKQDILELNQKLLKVL